MVGSESPIAPNFAGAEHLLSWDKAAAELALVDVEEPLDLVALFQLGREQIVEMSEGMPRNTDDNMRIEYSAPRNLHAQTHEENFTLLLRNAIVPFDSIERDPLLLADLARNYQARKDVRAMKTIVEAIKLLPNDSGLRSDLIGEAAEWQQALVAEFEETRDDDREE